MVSINDIVWSEEADNEKIENAIPINCMTYNCAYHVPIVPSKSTVGICPDHMITLFDKMNAVFNCSVL